MENKLYKHFIILGFDIKESGVRKIALHIPVVNDEIALKQLNEYKDILKNKIQNLHAISYYTLGASTLEWKDFINENRYFSTIEKPSSIDEFVDLINSSTINAIDVSKHIFSFQSCTNLRLQKLLYLVYQEYLKTFDTPLFDDKFYAWTYGPVCKRVYDEYNNIKEIDKENDVDKIKKDPLSLSMFKLYSHQNAKAILEIINGVMNKYKNYSTNSLVDLVHNNNSAWIKTKLFNEIKDIDIKKSEY